MTKTKRKLLLILTLLLVWGLLFSVLSSAVSVNFTKHELEYFQPIKDKRPWIYPSVTVTLGDKTVPENAYLINDTTYIPFRAAATLAGAAVGFQASSRTATAKMAGLEIYASDGSYIIYANERALLSKTPAIILDDGKMYIPIRSLAKALSLSVEWTPRRVVKLDGSIKPLTHANDYYNQDDLYWLSRIISAESQGEPLLGQIAVGNVVLNRKASRDYPNTVYGVIFDRKYGVQFSPAADGSVYRTPSYLSVQAAKICLEGISISEKILFFLEPTKANSAWIVLNRKYAFTIANHYFFY